MKELKIYTMEEWEKDGSFKAEPGQQISEEIYNQMLNCMPPKSIPRGKAAQALQDYNIPVHAGFLMGEPHSHNEKGKALYLAFGKNDFGSGTRREPKYFYLGLSVAEQPIADGFYYYFDCMNAFVNGNLFKAAEFKDDKEAISWGANYEADVYKYEYKNGERISSKMLYSPWDCMEG